MGSEVVRGRYGIYKVGCQINFENKKDGLGANSSHEVTMALPFGLVVVDFWATAFNSARVGPES